jgi:hypothetical protein
MPNQLKQKILLNWELLGQILRRGDDQVVSPEFYLLHCHHTFVTKQKISDYRNTNERHYTAPIGMRWNNNSCTYDSIFTSIYVQWCAYRNQWSDIIKRSGSATAIQLIEGFANYEAGHTLLEDVQDSVWRYMARNHTGCVYGAFASIFDICSPLLNMNETVFEYFYQCPNGHSLPHSNSNYALLSAGRTPYTSIAQWILSDTVQIAVHCQECHYPAAALHFNFCWAPPILAFELSAQPNITINHLLRVQLDDKVYSYSLATVIYYSQAHFTSLIITHDGWAWYYNGLSIADPAVDPTLICSGSIHDPTFSKTMENKCHVLLYTYCESI